MLARQDGIVLPAGVGENEIARRETRRLRGDDLGDAAAGHDRIGLDRRAIGRALHPGPIGRVERNVAHPQKGFAVLKFRDLRFNEAEVLGAELAGRLFDQQNLTIDAAIHNACPL